MELSLYEVQMQETSKPRSKQSLIPKTQAHIIRHNIEIFLEKKSLERRLTTALNG
jgi:hypothetical protein